MSTPVCPNEGELDVLVTYKTGSYKCALFSNNVTPSATSVKADFTDATFSGYTSGGTALSYGSNSTNGSGQASSTATAINFDHNGGGTSNTIYGYYIYNTSTNKVIKAEKFDNAVTMQYSGDRITITDTMLIAGTIT